jgi:hypothetical protein
MRECHMLKGTLINRVVLGWNTCLQLSMMYSGKPHKDEVAPCLCQHTWGSTRHQYDSVCRGDKWATALHAACTEHSTDFAMPCAGMR